MQYVLEFLPFPESVKQDRLPRPRATPKEIKQFRFRFVVSLSNPDAERVNRLAMAARLGDAYAAERLMGIYRPIVVLMANRISVADLTRHDVVGCAMAGFAKAIRTYDGRGGTPFDFYAKRLVSNALAEVVRTAHQKRVVPPSLRCEFDAEVGRAAETTRDDRLDEMRAAWRSIADCSPEDRAWLLGIPRPILDEFERVLN
ncbi:MAG: hypothetical protein JNJ45_05520 [Chthonomonas sp.]|nr:hypothetical protein [Chthonomonas sp.]